VWMLSRKDQKKTTAAAAWIDLFLWIE